MFDNGDNSVTVTTDCLLRYLEGTNPMAPLEQAKRTFISSPFQLQGLSGDLLEMGLNQQLHSESNTVLTTNNQTNLSARQNQELNSGALASAGLCS